MARPRKPTNVLEASGAFKKNPNRARPSEPKVEEPIGKPPMYMAGPAKKIWKEILKLAPNGVMTRADSVALELCANLLSEYRNDPAEFSAQKLARMESLLGKFGMNPSDRSKLSISQATEANPFDDLI